MTKTDLFRVIIKIFGIYCFINAIFSLIPNFTYSGGFSSVSLSINTFYLLINGLIAYLLVFQTDRLIKLFRLGKGFDTEIIDTRNLKTDGLFKVALIFIGLLMITNNIAQFLDFCYLAFKKQISARGLGEIDGAMLQQQLDYHWWIINGLNIIFGIIILTNYKWIAKLFEEKEKNVG
nr:hypothetical protein [Allomuricauda sp.]